MLTPFGCDSAWGGGNGDDAGALWRCSPGKRGAFFHARLVANGGKGVSVRRLGNGRAGEMRITRFLHNPDVTVEEMVSTASARTCTLVRGRHVLAIQDTTTVRVDKEGCGLSLHPVIAVDANERTLLGLVDAYLLQRKGGERGKRKKRDFEQKDSCRWLDGARSASALAEAGAVCVTVIEDREGDIYESFVFKPDNVEKLVRAGQDRALADDSRLFAKTDSWAEAGQVTVDLPAAPGRKARQAVLSLRYGAVKIRRPDRRREALAKLPDTVTLQLVDVREIDPPKNEVPAHWRLLTTHTINDIADARWSSGKTCRRQSHCRRHRHAAGRRTRRKSQTSSHRRLRSRRPASP